jgi:hypothetical protein
MRRRYTGPRGSIDHPASALTLRRVLAVFGLITCASLAVVAWALHSVVATWLLAVLAVIAIVDLVVIQYRIGRRP